MDQRGWTKAQGLSRATMPLSYCYWEEREELAPDPSSTQGLTKALGEGWLGRSCATGSSGPRQHYMVYAWRDGG